MSRPPRIMLSAGEASGDRLGADLARAIRSLQPDVELFGMGGDEMAAAGVRLVQHLSAVSVMGLFEVVRHLPALHRTMTLLEETLARERPDVIVPIDFPDFNLRLAARAHRSGTSVVYFVSPQVWAWRRGRVLRIKPFVNRMLVLFPFEAEFYEQAGIPVTFVGHPAAERLSRAVDRDALRRAAGLDPAREVVALVPGSRSIEVERILPTLLDAARIVNERRPAAQFLVTRAATMPAERMRSLVDAAGPAGTVVHDSDFPEILRACDAGAVASGTASLEAGLAGLPMVVVYRIHPVSFLLAKRLVHVEHAALPNLIADEPFVPELIQGDFRAEAVAEILLGYLESPEDRRAMRATLDEIRQRLRATGGLERAARAVLAEIEPAGDTGIPGNP